ncbi:tissue factor pathway inhibitor 2 [Dromiciops gliroides]|uniref:tissue factor pathway inhibitor 2 n=1 Tax=Dromiciops gliroides TaxID=33562 RepID=UPI001CC6A853|nr:tissue factor pathway inhibitor 2 [Dromiciops gliroides]
MRRQCERNLEDCSWDPSLVWWKDGYSLEIDDWLCGLHARKEEKREGMGKGHDMRPKSNYGVKGAGQDEVLLCCPSEASVKEAAGKRQAAQPPDSPEPGKCFCQPLVFLGTSQKFGIRPAPPRGWSQSKGPAPSINREPLPGPAGTRRRQPETQELRFSHLSTTVCQSPRFGPGQERSPFTMLTLLLLLWSALLLRPGLGDAQPEPRDIPPARCLLPPDDGPCRARLPSFYYDRHLQSCRPFIFGGCEGNANNFETPEDCEQACGWIPRVPKICRLEASGAEFGEYQEQQYFFNLSSMACEKFVFTGGPGNHNRFPDAATCKDFCAPVKAPQFCYSPPDGGSCSANVTRYYFNWKSKICEPFTYTGCGGNENNFVSLRDCSHVCVKALKKKLRRTARLRFAKKKMRMYKKLP